VLRPAVDGEHNIRPPRGQRIAAVESGGRAAQFTAGSGGAARLKLAAGREYRITFR
jgi:hypothetical protein